MREVKQNALPTFWHSRNLDEIPAISVLWKTIMKPKVSKEDFGEVEHLLQSPSTSPQWRETLKMNLYVLHGSAQLGLTVSWFTGD